MTRWQRAAVVLAAACLFVAAHGPVMAMTDLAERYVKLVLAVGVHAIRPTAVLQHVAVEPEAAMLALCIEGPRDLIR